MNKRARVAAETARCAALDAALDNTIEAAALPLRVTPGDVALFDAQNPSPPAPLDAARSRRLVTTLRRAVATADLSLASTEEASPSPSFGELVRHARERSRLGLPDVARRLHVHRDYLAGLESGVRSPLALGTDGARRLVGLLGLPPQLAARALEISMQAALRPTPEFNARMRRGVPRKERLRVLEAALPYGPSPEQEREWRTLIDAVDALED